MHREELIWIDKENMTIIIKQINLWAVSFVSQLTIQIQYIDACPLVPLHMSPAVYNVYYIPNLHIVCGARIILFLFTNKQTNNRYSRTCRDILKSVCFMRDENKIFFFLLSLVHLLHNPLKNVMLE